MDELQPLLQQLIQAACEHPPGHPIRQTKLTQIIRLVKPKLWRESVDYYEDALQQTWLYLAKNLCRYDATRALVVTWLNNHLKWRLHELKLAHQQREFKETSIDARNEDPDQPTFEIADPISLQRDEGDRALNQEFLTWVQTDPDGQLKAAHMRGLPQINCQVLIQRRFIEDVTWQTLEIEWKKPLPSLASHFQRKCIPCLRKKWNEMRNNDD
jgi:hypothetical protein